MNDEERALNPGDDCPVCEHPLALIDQGDQWAGEIGHCWCPLCGWDEECDSARLDNPRDEPQEG